MSKKSKISQLKMADPLKTIGKIFALIHLKIVNEKHQRTKFLL